MPEQAAPAVRTQKIVSRGDSSRVLFECEIPADVPSGLALRHALERAASSGANLSDANLRDANLSGHTLVGDRPFFQIGPIGSRSDYLTLWLTDDGPFMQTGCFFGTRDQFESAVRAEHGDSQHGAEYTAALVLMDAHTSLWMPASEKAAEAAKEPQEVAA